MEATSRLILLMLCLTNALLLGACQPSDERPTDAKDAPASSDDATALLDAFAARILTHHPRLPWPKAPDGWCSWYAYYEKISADLILANLAALKANAPGLRYVQIDDGYQPWMGDWLESTDKFVGGVEAYRLGMEAIRHGAGPESLLLGCNHAYWPSLGTVHASRTSFLVFTPPPPTPAAA